MKAAQTQLAGYGHRVAADGVFGPATKRATVAFQRSHGLTADGIIGPKTWNKLISGKTSGAPAAPEPSTPPAGNGKLTNQQALSQLRAAGITWSSSGNCTERRRGCTSFDGVRARSIQGVIALKKASGCPVVVTAGTEPGHSSGTYSHYNGYKLDLRIRNEGACITKYIPAHNKAAGTRGDGARLWKGQLAGGIDVTYAKEGDHWDITFK
ncbi:peptidoglycan-binding domain-containing protein [Streptomyces sp. M2CJ-2]|uniref:peptidoglycan-binding domain-containing protein n=1 Tax=Streptomyces sp. M2CJ-2 TaxID=2803948 RepID=UPI0027DB73C3|nr:peptidoglycan-binding domain-containing protein [Streptomyces sp. M2CJ-2]